MFSHIMVGANDIEASKAFYDATLGALGYGPGITDEKGRVFYMTDTGIFAISMPIDGAPAGHGNGSTIGFAAGSTDAADAWRGGCRQRWCQPRSPASGRVVWVRSTSLTCVILRVTSSAPWCAYSQNVCLCLGPASAGSCHFAVAKLI